jgi:two-component system, cell cycle response regulator
VIDVGRSRYHATTKRMVKGPSEDASPAAPQACVVVVQGRQLGHRVELADSVITLGRAPECELCLPDHSVSRRHCRIEPAGEGFELVDLESTNRTFLNGAAVDRSLLKDGDRIELGRNVLKFFDRDSSESDYHAVLLELALRDSLTGLMVRRRFRELLDERIGTLQPDVTLGLLILDLDHFKPVNDRLGHLAGDQVLRAFAALLRAGLPDGAIAGRLGGEEFAVLTSGVDSAGLVALADKLRQDQAEQRVRIGEELVRVTVSIGCAMWDESMGSAGELLRLSDRALYQAKDAGRNCVILYRPEA